MMNRYIHLDDDTRSGAADRVAMEIDLQLRYSGSDLKWTTG